MQRENFGRLQVSQSRSSYVRAPCPPRRPNHILYHVITVGLGTMVIIVNWEQGPRIQSLSSDPVTNPLVTERSTVTQYQFFRPLGNENSRLHSIAARNFSKSKNEQTDLFTNDFLRFMAAKKYKRYLRVGYHATERVTYCGDQSYLKIHMVLVTLHQWQTTLEMNCSAV